LQFIAKVIYFNLPGNQSYATGSTHLASQLHTHKMQPMLQAENLTKRICSGNLDYKVQNAIPQNISILLAPFPFLILLLMDSSNLWPAGNLIKNSFSLFSP
jgi:hypothetical protein